MELAPGEKQDFLDDDTVPWIQAGAEHGNVEAQAMLGMLYAEGSGVSKDLKKSLVWTLKAAEQGDVSAQLDVAAFYYSGVGEEIPQDFERSLVWFKKVAAQNISDGLEMQAQMTRRGEGTPKDLAAALEFDRQVNDAYNIGIAYRLGRGVARDEHKALEFFLKAVEQHRPFAACAIGTLYLEGREFPHDKIQAYRWLTRGNQPGQGHDETCTKKYTALNKTMTPRDFDLAETNPADRGEAKQDNR